MMEGDGIVLLDPEQQRTLYGNTLRAVESAESLSTRHRHHQSHDSQTTVSNGSTGKQSFTTTGSTGKRSIATAGGSPRTNFTTRNGDRPRIQIPPTHLESFQEDGINDPWMFEIPRESTSAESTAERESQDMSMKLVVAGIAVGFAFGIVFQFWKISPVAAQWVNLPCELFLRALQCVVVPYVFCSVAVAIGDIVYVGKISIVGFQTAKIFLTFWVATTIMGMTIAMLFRPLFRQSKIDGATPLNAIKFSCDNNNETLTMLSNSSISCLADANMTAPEVTFVVKDVENVLAKTATTSAMLGLSDLLYVMIQYTVSANLTNSFIKSELLSIITFSMVLGSIAGRNFFRKSRRVNYLYLTLLQLRDALFLMMEWIIAATPIVLVSFIASFMGANSDSLGNFRHAYYYVLAGISAAVFQMVILLPLIVFFMTRCNPYNHMRKMVRAYVFSLACSSSIATTPVTLSCLKRARVCSQSLSNFVISIGVSSSTSAMGFYLPIAVTFLAESSGQELTVPRLIGVFALSIVLCVGTPPIPAAGINMLLIIYPVLTGASQMPPSFTYLIAMDVIVDRFATLCNINDDIMAVKIIAENTDETVTQEHLGERS